MKKPTSSAPPAHLSEAMRAWWRSVSRGYKLKPHHYRVLEAACDSWDRTVAARAEVLRDGLCIPNRWGELRPHPSLATERDNRIAFVRCVRELALADDDLPAESRPPRLTGRYAGRE